MSEDGTIDSPVIGEPSPRWVQTPIAEFVSESAKTLADYAGIFQDLTFVTEACQRLDALMREHEDKQDVVLTRALWSAIVVAYWRCFNTGKRFGLTEDDVLKLGLKGEVIEYHRWIGDMRNKHIADSVNPFEIVRIGAVLTPDGAEPAGVQGVATMSAHYLTVDEGGVQQIFQLAAGLRQPVAQRAQALEATVLEEARQVDIETLRTLPRLSATIPAPETAGGPR